MFNRTEQNTDSSHAEALIIATHVIANDSEEICSVNRKHKGRCFGASNLFKRLLRKAKSMQLPSSRTRSDVKCTKTPQCTSLRAIGLMVLKTKGSAKQSKNVFSPLTFPFSPNQAFNLSEVIITLGIIGVVAALTLPSLISDADDAANAKAMLKMYSAMNNAINLYISDNGGDFKDTGAFANGQDNTVIWNDYFKKYFAISKDCFATSGCFAGDAVRLNGNGWQNLAAGLSGTSRLVLNDGTAIRIWNAGSNCNAECIEVIVDVNGYKKPNKAGRDTFVFSMRRNKLLPYPNGADCVEGGYGFSCSYRVLTEGKINY